MISTAVELRIHRDDFVTGQIASNKTVLGPQGLFDGLKRNLSVWVRELRQNPKNMDLAQNPQCYYPPWERNFVILARPD